MTPSCNDRTSVLYAWAHNAGYDSYDLPKGWNKLAYIHRL